MLKLFPFHISDDIHQFMNFYILLLYSITLCSCFGESSEQNEVLHGSLFFSFSFIFLNLPFTYYSIIMNEVAMKRLLEQAAYYRCIVYDLTGGNNNYNNVQEEVEDMTEATNRRVEELQVQLELHLARLEHHRPYFEALERPMNRRMELGPFVDNDDDDDDDIIDIADMRGDIDDDDNTNDDIDGDAFEIGNRMRRRINLRNHRRHRLYGGRRAVRRGLTFAQKSYRHYTGPFDIPKSDPNLEHRRRWLKQEFAIHDNDDEEEEEKRCVLCKPMVRLVRHSTICRSCYEDIMMMEKEEKGKTTSSSPLSSSSLLFSSSSEDDDKSLSTFRSNHKVWKLLMITEQTKYTKNLGRTDHNEREAIHIRQNPVCDTRKLMSSNFKGHGITPELLMLKRIKACIGWAIHGVVMEFIDGSTRGGYDCHVASLYDDEQIRKRQGTEWIDVAEGDYVISVSGHHLARQCFLCHTLRFEMASGRVIEFASSHEPWKGGAFQYELPESALLQFVSFRNGKCIGVTATETRLHLPLRSTAQVQQHLPTSPHQDTFRTIQLCIQRYENNRVQAGERPLGRDMWSKVLYEYLKGSDLQSYEESTLGQLKACQRDASYKKCLGLVALASANK